MVIRNAEQNGKMMLIFNEFFTVMLAQSTKGTRFSQWEILNGRFEK